MISRIHYNQVFDIGVFVDLEGIVEFIKIINFSGVHHKLESDGAVLI